MIILVIESNQAELSGIASLIGKLYPQARVFPFDDGMEAVQYGFRHPVSIVFSAVRLPHLTGFDVVRLLRKRNPALKAFLFDDTDQHAERTHLEQIGQFCRKAQLENVIRQWYRDRALDYSL